MKNIFQYILKNIEPEEVFIYIYIYLDIYHLLLFLHSQRSKFPSGIISLQYEELPLAFLVE